MRTDLLGRAVGGGESVRQIGISHINKRKIERCIVSMSVFPVYAPRQKNGANSGKQEFAPQLLIQKDTLFSCCKAAVYASVDANIKPQD